MANLTPLPSVDRVRTESQERLDKPDFDATLALTDEAIQRQLGALLGFGSGVTAPPAVDTSKFSSTAQRIFIGAFQYYISVPTWTDSGTTFKGWRGVFVTFDPASESQDNSIDLAGPYNAHLSDPADPKAFPGIYAQPQFLDTDTDARRKWVGSSEMAVSMTTRSRIRTVFKLSTAAPENPANTGWALVGQVRWNGNTPDIFWRPWLDNFSAEGHSLDLPSGTTGLDSFASARSSAFPLLRRLGDGGPLLPGGAFTGAGVQRDLGLIQLLTVLRKRFADVLYGTLPTDGNWISQVLPGSVSALANRVTKEMTVGFLVTFDEVTSTYSVDADANIPDGWSVTVAKDLPQFRCNVTVTGPGTSWAVQSATANANSPSDLATFLDTPWTPYRFRALEISKRESGDPLGRVYVRQWIPSASSTAVLADGPFYISVVLRKTA